MPTSPVITPPSVFDYDVEKRTSTLLKQNEVPGGYDPSKYKSERVWATARDGVKVPVSVVYRTDMKKADGSNPLYVYAYGSYGFPLPVTFSSNRLSLAGPRLGDGLRAHSRRRRDGQGLARCRAHDEQDEYLHRLHRLHGVSGAPTNMARATRSPSKAAPPAAC